VCGGVFLKEQVFESVPKQLKRFLLVRFLVSELKVFQGYTTMSKTGNLSDHFQNEAGS